MNILLNTPPLNVYEHMALDEQMVHLRPTAVTLRFYNWTDGPAATFGYAQFVREVRQTLRAENFTGHYTRRPTGGGVVFHKDDLTFSLVFSFPGRPVEIYRNLHRVILTHLSRAGVSGHVLDTPSLPAAYAPSVNHQASACFIRPVENDLLTENGQKMLGGAIRRFGETVLYQGSLQLAAARQNPALKRAIIDGVRDFFAVDLRPVSCGAARLAAARQLAAAQYADMRWTEKF